MSGHINPTTTNMRIEGVDVRVMTMSHMIGLIMTLTDIIMKTENHDMGMDE